MALSIPALKYGDFRAFFIKEFEAYFQGKPNEVEVVTRTIAVVNKKDQHKNK